jgi:hypothetical protein
MYEADWRLDHRWSFSVQRASLWKGENLGGRRRDQLAEDVRIAEGLRRGHSLQVRHLYQNLFER